MIDILLPEVAEGVTEATIVQWNFRPGEKVRAGEVLLEIMTDKVNIEVESAHDGELTEILHTADEEVRVGAVIGKFQPD
jgi:2-oxoglutarate dehydrogenase E2 component (dihydrolipoamide succinyltransferase)